MRIMVDLAYQLAQAVGQASQSNFRVATKGRAKAGRREPALTSPTKVGRAARVLPVNPQTVIETTEGKTLKFEDLKEGDGVGLTHVSSVAKKIVVAVKPQR